MLTSHSRLVGGAAATALVLGTTLAGLGSSGAQAVDSGSPIKLWAPAKVTAYAYDDELYTDFGVRIIAAQEAFEIRSHRPDDYSGPVTAEWRSGDGAFTPLSQSFVDFRGLPDFLEMTITRVSDGKVMREFSSTSCLNAWSSERIRPDAPARSPYPTGCPWNPYTVGSVMGVQAGHAVPAFNEWESPVSLKKGTYDVTVSIADAFATEFGVLPEDASVTTRMKVRKERYDYRPAHRGTTGKPLRPNAQPPQGQAPSVAPGDPLPDLRSLPAWNINLNRKGTTMRFAATVWNAGDSPLVIDGFRSTEDTDRLDVYQYFFDSEGEQVSYTEDTVGAMHWHAENHNHWHFEDFAQYRLYNETMDKVVLSTKQSFCLANTDAVDYTVPGADWNPENTDLSSACQGYDALSVRQVLSAGSGDTYMQYRFGQAFPIKKLPNGVYYIGVEANPVPNLVESDTTNNDSYRKVTLKGKGKNRRVVAARVGVIDEYMDGWFARR